ncbi:MAG: family 14 glycosylhydrolase, partial [Candidatus Omnitrophica bacterium]|nr:family 14 glycosylhydrolase [Candidatus Omnitrophota bacterium]
EESSARTIFSVSETDSIREMKLVNRDRCEINVFDGADYLEIEKDRDPYSPVEWILDISKGDWNGTTPVFEIVFYDKGAGVIEPELKVGTGPDETTLRPSRAASFTRLNSMRERSAYFEFDFDDSHRAKQETVQLRISGLQYLREIIIHPSFDEEDWKKAKESIPKKVEPLVRLERPIQLVTTAGFNSKGTPDTLDMELEMVDEFAPLAKVLGFTSIESYVRWNWLEPETEGQFDFHLVDATVDRIKKHDLKWFPLLVVGSAYALPDWFKRSQENVGFVCLEHGIENPIQSIWSPHHKRHVTRVLQAFGKHYEPMGILEGVRLGPSGNYGESQYPAGGNWPAAGEGPMHIHIGYWAGDEYARENYRDFIKGKYETIEAVNQAWETQFKNFSEIQTTLPLTIPSFRPRLDFTEWYTDSMTDWCDWWVEEAGKALPNTKIYQSSGGWGFRESGTDYTAQTKSMLKVDGGIRLTNETDSFDQNFYATRLAATAARLYEVDLGYEPASSHTARGIVGRIFNTVTTNGDHLFTYHRNVMQHQMSIDKWLENLHFLDERQDPLIDVAVYYPETMNQLEDATFRHLYAWGFNPRAREIRRKVEVDYLDERLIREGFLDRYKVLVHVWGDVIEADVEEKIDDWIRNGGTLIYPSFPRGSLSTVEGDPDLFSSWSKGDTGNGAFIRYQGDMEPPSLYADYVHERLLDVAGLHPWTKQILESDHSEHVFSSIQKDGHLMVLNYSGEVGFIDIPHRPRVSLEPYSIHRISMR